MLWTDVSQAARSSMVCSGRWSSSTIRSVSTGVPSLNLTPARIGALATRPLFVGLAHVHYNKVN